MIIRSLYTKLPSFFTPKLFNLWFLTPKWISSRDIDSEGNNYPFRNLNSSKLIISLYKKLGRESKIYDELSREILELQSSIEEENTREINLLIEEKQQEANNYMKYKNYYNNLEKVLGELSEAEGMLLSEREGELGELWREEVDRLEGELEELKEIILDHLLEKDDFDLRDAKFEIFSAVGGKESASFAYDLMLMYQQYVQNMGWKWEVKKLIKESGINNSVKRGEFTIKGEDAYYYLKHEIGVHKVQRVPATESKGRIHSSTAVIVVMPIISKEYTLEMKDVRIDTYRASGPGGQHVNTTDSAVRALHKPTGIMATNQDERTQHDNKKVALKNLQERVINYYVSQDIGEVNEQRRMQIGTGNLGEKIRTYNYPNDRITDHRLGKSVFGMEKMLKGMLLEDLIDEMIDRNRNKRINDLIEI